MPRQLLKAFILWLGVVLPLHGSGGNTGGDMNIAVQLWSVHEEVAADFEGTLHALAAMGFEGVEFAGDYGPYADDPAALKNWLATLGLQVAGAHVSTDQLRGEALVETLAFHRALGTPFLVIPWDDRAWDDQGVHELAAELNALNETLSQDGLRIGYHNHANEMAAVGDSTYWDVLAAATDNAVILQQDVGWTTYAGRDAVALVRRYPGRTLTTHLKVKPPGDGATVQPFIGQGETHWTALLQACREVGGTRWFVVEQEDYPEGLSPMASVERSLRGLEAVIAKMQGVTGSQ